MLQKIKISDKLDHWLNFLLAMSRRELKVRYKSASLGFLWIIVYPLIQMAIMGLVFSFFVPIEIDQYFLFLFTGLLPWNFFSTTLLQATPNIVYRRQMIKKANFPREIMTLSIVLSNLVHFLTALFLLVIFLLVDMLFIKNMPFSIVIEFILNSLLIIPLTFWLLFTIIGFSLLFSALNTRNRDINFLIKAVMPLWFYVTPILYSFENIPQKFQPLFAINPLVAIISHFRGILLGSPTIDLGYSLVSIFLSLLIMIIGVKTFSILSKKFDDWI